MSTIIKPRLCADIRNAVVQLHNAYLRDDQRATAKRNSALETLTTSLALLIEYESTPNPQYYDAAQALVATLYQLARTTAASPYETGTAAEQAQTALSHIQTLESLLD